MAVDIAAIMSVLGQAIPMLQPLMAAVGSSVFGGSSIGESLGSMANKETGAGLTGAQKATNEFNANEAEKARQFNAEQADINRQFNAQQAELAYNRQRDLTKDQWSLNVEGMQNAGLNPALAYGGIQTPSTPTAANGSAANGSAAQAGSNTNGASMSELMALLTMPLQLEQLKANIEKTEAETKNTEQRTLTEEQLTAIRTIEAQYKGRFSEAELTNLMQTYNKMVADTNLAQAQTNHVKTQNQAQEIMNEYLPELQQSTIDKMDSEKRLNIAKAGYEEWLNGFVRANNFLPSSNDMLQIVTYLGDLLGVSKDALKGFIGNLPNTDLGDEVKSHINRFKDRADRFISEMKHYGQSYFKPWEKTNPYDSFDYWVMTHNKSFR